MDMTKTALRTLTWTWALSLGLATGAISQADRPFDPQSMPDVVAKVNGREIYRAELLTQAEVIRSQAKQRGQEDPGRQGVAFYREVLDGLIGEMLVYDDGAERGLSASEEEVDGALRGLQERFPDAAAFDQALSEQGTHRQELRQQLRRTLSIEKVVSQEIAAQVEVTAADKERFYEQNQRRFSTPERRRVRHILRRVSPTADAAEKATARSMAAEILQRLGTGEDFAELAARHSEDTETRDRGGELPWVVMSGEGSPFYNAIAELATGGLSGVVETEAGFHVIELLEISPAKKRPFAEVEDAIEAYLQDSAIFEKVQKRVTDLRAKAEIELSI